MTNKFQIGLIELQSLVDRQLDKYLPKENKDPKIIHRAMRYSIFSGGKRIRPILTIESSRISGGVLKDAMPAACAIELVHTYSLIHDDLPSMDNDDYRRGRPTCHKKYGEANAILAGDALLTLAFQVLAEEINPKISASVIRELASSIGAKGMVGGQALDIQFKKNSPSVAPLRRNLGMKLTRKFQKTLEHINCLKTAKLFEASAKIGAITAGATRAQTSALAKYGNFLGMAFQVIDDMIDNEGYAAILGMDKAYKYSRFLTKSAKASLGIFSEKAAALSQMAEYISERKR